MHGGLARQACFMHGCFHGDMAQMIFRAPRHDFEVDMNSKERHEGRYQRRFQKREEKRKRHNAKYDDFTAMTDTNNLMESARLSRKGVGKKASVQKYIENMMRNVTEARMKLENGEDVREGFIEFTLNERGKERDIRAMHIKERVIQRNLCDYILIPILERALVYDNGASMKGKGIHFALERMCQHLRRYIRTHGTDGYILLVDFTGYFDNIEHGHIREIIDKNFEDERVKALIWDFVTAFGEKSLGIGSQVSQILAVCYANAVDHRIKEVYRHGLSGRYMDDSYVIGETREELQAILDDCREQWAKLGIKVNERKTIIVPIRKFTYMKVRFRVTDTGKVLMLPCKASFKRMRKKIRKFMELIDADEITMEYVRANYQSWYGYQKHFNAHRMLRNMDRYYHDVLGEWPQHKKR